MKKHQNRKQKQEYKVNNTKISKGIEKIEKEKNERNGKLKKEHFKPRKINLKKGKIRNFEKYNLKKERIIQSKL